MNFKKRRVLRGISPHYRDAIPIVCQLVWGFVPHPKLKHLKSEKKGSLGLWIRNIGEKKEKTAMTSKHREFSQSPLSPLSHLFLLVYSLIRIPKKRGNLFSDVSTAYGRFLSISTITAPTTAIATIMPATEGRKYMSDKDVGVRVGPGVASGAASTVKLVVSLDGQ